MDNGKENPRVGAQITVPQRYIELLIGTALGVLGFQLFTVPLGLYNGGTMGVSQLVRTLLTDKLGVSLGFDLAGMLNLLLNIPLMLLAYKGLSKSFVARTIFVMAVQTVVVSVVPSGIVLVSDPLTACIIGGVLGGAGTGMILRAGGSTAGFDILSVWLAKTRIPLGVGTITGCLNAMVYIICALAFDLQTAIYSLIFAFVTAFVTDRFHTQGINCGITIVTSHPDIAQSISAAVSRGVTVWHGEGGHTGDGKYICYIVANKFEETVIRKIVEEKDPHAFMVTNENVRVTGNYARRIN